MTSPTLCSLSPSDSHEVSRALSERWKDSLSENMSLALLNSTSTWSPLRGALLRLSPAAALLSGSMNSRTSTRSDETYVRSVSANSHATRTRAEDGKRSGSDA